MYLPNPIEQNALRLIRDEKSAWEFSNVWVSSDAYFTMRSEIDKARKNYYGQFEEPVDKNTKLEKLWIPLTEWTCERIIASIDLDTKDVQLRHPEGKDIRVPAVMRLIVLNFLRKINFGEFLNDFIRRLVIDGTAIVKCFKFWNPEYKRNLPVLRIVDPLNFIIDPTVYSVQDGPIIEKSVMTRDEVEKYRGKWKNLDEIKYEGSVPTCIIYERWGKLPLDWITGEAKDTDRWVEGTIVASGDYKKTIGTGRQGEILVIHSIQRNTKNIKPFEECWLKRVPARFHGRGVPEQIKGLQEWLNAVVNIRREEMLNKLAGKYKYRKGSGITKQMLEQTRAGGAIPVDEMDDIQELRESDVKASAYREPLDTIAFAEKVTGAKEIPASPTMQATTSVIQEREVRSITNLIQENIGLFLERLFKRHLVPLTLQCLKDGEILRITGEPEDLDIIDEAAVNYYVQDISKNRNFSLYEKRDIRQRAENQYKKMGKDRSLKVVKHIFDTDYDLDIRVTTERFNPAIVLRNINDFLLVYGRLPQADVNIINSVVREYLFMLDIPVARHIKPKAEVPMPGMPGASPQPRKEIPTERTELQRAALEGILSPAEK